LQGGVRPVRVVSGSMAPAYLGPHVRHTCGDCGFGWEWDATSALEKDRAVCPNCGFADNELKQAVAQSGQRVVIDRAAYWLRPPRRFEPVALLDPTNPAGLALKRLVAMPGETLEVRGGELWIDGRLARKSLSRLREMAVLVHDDRFRPKDRHLPKRWTSDSGWAQAASGYSYAGDFQSFAALRTRPRIEWLSYHHWRCSPLPGLRTKVSPVLDFDSYNPGTPRQLNEVSDLLVRFQAQTIGEGWLAVALHDRKTWWEIRLWPRRGEILVLRDGREVAQASARKVADDQPFLWEAALCDRQVLVATEGRTVLAYRYAPSPEKPDGVENPVRLGAAGLAAEVRDVTIWRDVYYLPPPAKPWWKADQPLGERGYLVLGDNTPISQDSRTWRHNAVSQAELQGPVFSWPFAPRR
jgi:signal peptidase I